MLTNRHVAKKPPPRIREVMRGGAKVAIVPVVRVWGFKANPKFSDADKRNHIIN